MPITLTIDENALLAAMARGREQDGVGAQPSQPALSKHLTMRFYTLLPVQERGCPICYDDIRKPDDFKLLPCGHFFHKACHERAARAACAVCNQP
jgi:hypothetical protein